MQRKQKKFSWPRRLYDGPRIAEENKLVEKYGLKNKKEIWKAEAKVKYFRDRAKSLITEDSEEQNKFFARLNKIGLNVHSIADVLALNKEDLLKRRLSTVVANKGLAHTPRQARQMIVHKNILVNGQFVNVPSYLVPTEEESMITVRKKAVKAPVVSESSEVASEMAAEEIANE